MKIGILGAGNVGAALAQSWVRRNHDVLFGVPEPTSAKTKATLERLGPHACAATVVEAAAFGPVLVVATPWPATHDAITAAGTLTDKIVVDCTNPLRADLSGLELGHTTSAAEQIAQWAPRAKVFKAFNQAGANVMADTERYTPKPIMFVAGDHAGEPRATVCRLVADAGFDPIDAGPLTNARLLEPLAMLWIYMAFHGEGGRDFAFTFAHPHE